MLVLLISLLIWLNLFKIWFIVFVIVFLDDILYLIKLKCWFFLEFECKFKLIIFVLLFNNDLIIVLLILDELFVIRMILFFKFN